jgi:hypothetical protein
MKTGGVTGSLGSAPYSPPLLAYPATALPSDHWYYELFSAMPDLVCQFLPSKR